MKILTVPHKMLYREAASVEVFGGNLRVLIDKMFVTMYQHKGVGLAANQVGVRVQVIVLNTGHKPMALINPHIHHANNGQVWERESCLSIPGFSIPMGRSSKIYVTSYDRYGKEQDFTAEGLLARIIQHEIDHLHGVLINEK